MKWFKDCDSVIFHERYGAEMSVLPWVSQLFHLLHYTWQGFARCIFPFSNLARGSGDWAHRAEVRASGMRIKSRSVDMFVFRLEPFDCRSLFSSFSSTQLSPMTEMQLVFLNMRCFNACGAWIFPKELLTFFSPCFSCSFFLSFFTEVQLLSVMDIGMAKKWNWQSYFNVQNVTLSCSGLCAADGWGKITIL